MRAGSWDEMCAESVLVETTEDPTVKQRDRDHAAEHVVAG
jgi:hypothetical protein